jgi:DNA-directed RNA polymerase specialized sigma subunit
MKKLKSKSYQHRIVEVSFEQSKLNNFSEDSGISHILDENSFSEEISELRSELLSQIYEIIDGEMLTEHQRKILYMVLLGKTQNQIADILGITQSAVHKALRGNLDYRNDRKRYGGIFKKLKKICNTNPKIQGILNQIDKTKEEVVN